ncbi:reverse transcriptase domain-containing protein [Tanacetum coccineum]
MANVTSLLTSLCTKIHDFGNTNQASSSSSLPSNTIPNPRNEARAITTRSGVSYEGPTIPMPPPFVNPDVVEETSTDHVPPPLTQKVQETNSQTTTKVNQEGIVNGPKTYELKLPYPERRNVEKRHEKDKVQLQKFWKMFKQLHFNISLADALILMPKYTKMLKDLCANKEKLEELAYDRLADLGASINLMPLSVFHRLGFTNLESTQMTLELANRQLCRPDGICKDVLVPVGKFTYPADFVVVDYAHDEQIPLILGRPFLRTARALIDVYDEKMFSDRPLFNLDDSFLVLLDEDYAVNPLFEENDKDVEIKSSSSVTLTSPEENVSIPPGINLTFPSTFEASSSNPTFPTLTREKIYFDSPFTAELSASVILNSLRNEDKVFKPGILVYLAIHDKNLITLKKKKLKENISSGTLLVFKVPSFLLPPPEPPDECLKKVVLNFYQSKKTFPLNVKDVNSFTFIIWTFLPYFTYTKESSLIFSLRSENFVFDPGILKFHNPVAVSMKVSICSP